jgi:hypothetical protein
MDIFYLNLLWLLAIPVCIVLAALLDIVVPHKAKGDDEKPDD